MIDDHRDCFGGIFIALILGLGIGYAYRYAQDVSGYDLGYEAAIEEISVMSKGELCKK